MYKEILVREWEYRLYCLWDWPFSMIETLWEKLMYKTALIRHRVLSAYWKNRVYYLAADERIRIKKVKSKQGRYVMIDKKMVMVGSDVDALDSFSFIPWKEANAGYYDEELDAHVESKQHYRRLMKAQGLIPVEPRKYGGSQSYRKQQELKYNFEKNRKQSEKVFNEARRKAEAVYGPLGVSQ